MRKIKDLCDILAVIRTNFIEESDKAYNKKQEAEKELNKNYVQNTPLFRERQAEINKKYNSAIISAKKQASQTGANEIEDLETWESTKLSRLPSDDALLTKLSALQYLPLSETELKALYEKSGTSNYWIQRMIANMAEKNGISPQAIGIPGPVDARLAVTRQLKDQLDRLIEGYDPSGKDLDIESRKARFLYLNPDILKNAIEAFEGIPSGTLGLSKADSAMVKINAADGYGKSYLIEENLKKMRKEADRNEFYYKLAMNTSVSSDILEAAGISAEIEAWRTGGKAGRYEEAVKLSRDIDKLTDSESITATLRAYALHNEQTGADGNEFVAGMLADRIERSDNMRDAVRELTKDEMRAIMSGGDSEGAEDVFEPKFM